MTEITRVLPELRLKKIISSEPIFKPKPDISIAQQVIIQPVGEYTHVSISEITLLLLLIRTNKIHG